MKLLIVEDDDSTRKMLEYICNRINCSSVGSIRDAISFLQKEKPDIILLDLLLNGDFCFPVIEESLKLYGRQVKIVVMSALTRGESIVSQYNVDKYLRKPFDLEEIEKSVFMH